MDIDESRGGGGPVIPSNFIYIENLQEIKNKNLII